ncbi:DUF2334 domain-containing protein [Exiguobacterium sp. s5]|uniref:DUF2334 domain-containing protein n=1 Tax=Exiguobacterium sp. s5 TaxID=2751239 RepID=UPI001BEAD68E|nr:DUF2334 domain-containing protein [Exiguobacterium sp. s5]
MRYKCLTIFLLLLLFPTPIDAAKPTHVVIVYSSSQVETPPDVYKLEALVSRFSDEIKLIRDIDLGTDALSEVSHIFYYGASTSTLPKSTRELLNHSSIPLYAIGQNANQLSPFKGLEMTRVAGVSKFLHARTDQSLSFEFADVVTTVKPEASSITHASVVRNDKVLPVLIQAKDNFYAGIENLLNRPSLFIADSLFDFFDVEASLGHVGYIRLEDINPSSDPELVKEVGTYLLDREIPIILAVIPVYTDAANGDTVRFTDRPELIDTLRELEARGATVIAHGYTHQYRSSETGEGFEFWDVENNQPVLSPPDEMPPKLKGRESFASESAYTSYLNTLLEKETTYIHSKLSNSIHELVSLGLHPLGFEAPHYAMSHSGYALTSEYFTNVFGQVQWSNSNWEVLGSTPYVSKPSLLQGMTLYPETIGYVRTDIPRPVDEMRRALEETLIVRESMIGAFYHPYIGTEYLPEVVALMESVPGFTWFDLRTSDERVRTDEVSVQSEDGVLVLKDNRSNILNRLSLLMPQSFLEQALTALAVITLLFVIAFLTYTLFLRAQRKKRLFKERG